MNSKSRRAVYGYDLAGNRTSKQIGLDVVQASFNVPYFFVIVADGAIGIVCRLRIDEAKKLLRTSSLPVTAVAHELGFSSSQYFATVFKRMEGLSPTEFRHRI